MTIVLTGTSAAPAIAQAFKPVMTLIINDANSPVPVTTVNSNLTHVGRPVSDIVQLSWSASNSCFVRQPPAGDLEAHCYTPPSGRSLVITDVRWRRHSGAATPGLLVGVLIHPPGGGAVFFSEAFTDQDGFASDFQHFQTGFIFHPDLIVQPAQSVTSFYGYLVPGE